MTLSNTSLGRLCASRDASCVTSSPGVNARAPRTDSPLLPCDDSSPVGFDPSSSESADEASPTGLTNGAVGSRPGWSSSHSASATHDNVHAPGPRAVIWSSDAKNAIAGILTGGTPIDSASGHGSSIEVECRLG